MGKLGVRDAPLNSIHIAWTTLSRCHRQAGIAVRSRCLLAALLFPSLRFLREVGIFLLFAPLRNIYRSRRRPPSLFIKTRTALSQNNLFTLIQILIDLLFKLRHVPELGVLAVWKQWQDLF